MTPSETHAPTQAIVDRLKRGDQSAFGSLLARYWPRVLLMVELNMSSELRAFADPEDLAQEVWIAAYRGIGGFEYRGDGAFFAWLGSVVRNRLRDMGRYARARKRRSGGALRYEGTDTPRSILEQIAAEQTSPSSKVTRSESFERLRAAIGALPQREREVIGLRFLEGRSVREAAALLGVSEGAVKMAVLRGLRALNQELEPLLG